MRASTGAAYGEREEARAEARLRTLIHRPPAVMTWPIEVHGYTKVFLTYFGPLNTNFEGDKPEIPRNSENFHFFLPENKKYVVLEKKKIRKVEESERLGSFLTDFRIFFFYHFPAYHPRNSCSAGQNT